jgi:hypothetical protein
VVTAVALIAIVAVVALTGHSSPPPQVATGPAVTTSDAQVLQATVDVLSRYVEQARGLTFDHPVKAIAYTSADFDAHLKALGGSRLDASQLSGRIATLQALGVLPLNFDPSKSGVTDTSQILGYYDPATKELAVRGACCDIYVRRTLIHELTHALQDQHFDLKRLLIPGEDDRALAVRALVEGDARRIDENWVSTLQTGEQNLLEIESRQQGDELFPAGFVLGFDTFPYNVGKDFTRGLIAIGGQAELDKAFATLPSSTKQIINPNAYAAGDNPRPVAPPPAGGAIVDQGTIGQFELIYVLAESISVQDAVALSADWGGSSFVTWRGPSGPCMRLRLETEQATGAEAMSVALNAWASDAPGRSVQGTNPITLNACA